MLESNTQTYVYQSQEVPSGKLPVLHNYSDRSSDKGALSIFVILVLTFTFILLLNLNHPIADEGFHMPQIFNLYNGDFRQLESLTVLPVYHGIVTALLKFSNFYYDPYMRFIHLLLSAFAIPIFYVLCKSLGQQRLDDRTKIFVLFPTVLPFFSLVYTDIPSLFVILSAILLCVRRRYILSALVGLFAVSVRQTNLIWVGFCVALIIIDYWQSYRPVSRSEYIRSILPLAKKILPYLAICMVIGSFLFINSGVAVGDTNQHKISLNLSNLYFLLLINFLLFLPYNIEQGQSILEYVQRKPLIWLIIGILFVVYMATFRVSHQYNSFGLSFYIHNVVLHYATNHPLNKALAFIPICWMALTFFRMVKISDRPLQLVTLYVFAALSIIPLPLVEPRYYIVATVLFIAWKPVTSKLADQVSLVMYILLSATLIYFISNHKIFV